jgi:hypothetical protein
MSGTNPAVAALCRNYSGAGAVPLMRECIPAPSDPFMALQTPRCHAFNHFVHSVSFMLLAYTDSHAAADGSGTSSAAIPYVFVDDQCAAVLAAFL